MYRDLHAKPNIEQLKKQAKALLNGFQEGNPLAVERLRSLISQPMSADPKLADAQHAIARDYGFASWPKLKEHVESLTRVLEPAERLSAAVCASKADSVARVLEEHPELKPQLNEPLANDVHMQALL